MFRFLIYIFTFCLLIISCTHLEKKEMAAVDPVETQAEFTQLDFSLLENNPASHREISAETTSLEKEFENLKTTDELEALIVRIDSKYGAIPDADKLLALEISFLRPFRSYNTMLNQTTIGMPGTDFLTLVSDIDTSVWKRNRLVNAYLNDSLEKSKRKVIQPVDVQEHINSYVTTRVQRTFSLISQLKSNSYKSIFCSFSCKSNKTVSPPEALKSLALFSAKLGFQAAYKYSDLFLVRKSSNASKQNDDALKTEPNLVTFKNSDFEIRSKIKDIYGLFGISINSRIWLKRAYDSYKTYTGLVIYLDPSKAKISQAFLGNHQIVFQSKVVLINLAALFDNPNPDLKNFMATKFDDKKRTPLEWDVDSYKAIFPNLRSNDEVPFHIAALASYFPGGLPFPLSIVFNPKTTTTPKAKK